MSLSLLDDLRKTARETQVEVLSVQLELPPAGVRSLLRLGAAERAVHAVRLRKSGDTPLMLNDAWMPERVGKMVTRASLERTPLYQILLNQGVTFGRVIQEISAEAASPMQASLLRTPVSAPLIRLTRLHHDSEGQPVEYLVSYLSPERSRIVMDISGEQIGSLSAGQVAHDERLRVGR